MIPNDSSEFTPNCFLWSIGAEDFIKFIDSFPPLPPSQGFGESRLGMLTRDFRHFLSSAVILTFFVFSNLLAIKKVIKIRETLTCTERWKNDFYGCRSRYLSLEWNRLNLGYRVSVRHWSLREQRKEIMVAQRGFQFLKTFLFRWICLNRG